MPDDGIITVMGPVSTEDSEKFTDIKEAPRYISSKTDEAAYGDDLRTWAEISTAQITRNPTQIDKLLTIGHKISRACETTAKDIMREHETNNKQKLWGTTTEES